MDRGHPEWLILSSTFKTEVEPKFKYRKLKCDISHATVISTNIHSFYRTVFKGDEMMSTPAQCTKEWLTKEVMSQNTYSNNIQPVIKKAAIN